MASQSSASSFKWEKPSHMCSRVSPTHCASASIPNLFPSISHAWTTRWILYPNFYACDIYMCVSISLYQPCMNHYEFCIPISMPVTYIYMCVWLSPGTLNGFGGLTKVMIYPACTTLLWRVVVLAFPVLGQIDAGWQDTWLTCKQQKHTNSRCPG